MDVMIDYDSPRAVKARFGKAYSGIWYRLSIIAIAVLLIVGIGCLVIQESVGWLILGLGALPFMLATWYNGELKRLPVQITEKQSIAGIIDPVVLGSLPKNPSALQLVNATAMTHEGQFLAARFGVTPRLLQDLVEHTNPTIEQVIGRALEIREEVRTDDLTPGSIALACIEQYADYETLLARIHLERKDVLEGIRWYQRLRQLIDAQKIRRKTGGIGRDWSFGYIPTLSRFGQNLSEQAGSGLNPIEIDSHERALEQMIETFGSGGAQNIALVGKEGVGKSTIVRGFAEKLMDGNAQISPKLKYQQVFMLDANSLLSAAPGRGQIENLIMTILGEAYAAKNIIIYLDNAQLFFEEGIGSLDLSNTLLPVIEAGRLRIILSMDEQRYLQISQRNSSLVNALNRISVQPASKTESIAVMQDRLIGVEFARNVTFTYQALHEAYRLSERYVHDLAMPGRAVKLLESSAGYSENGLVTINSVQRAIEETLDVKVSVASESEEREKLLQLEDHIHERMINQTRAVEVVSDALRRARAGVRNQNRPIGTFLFLGPTGVGKTELAKALADVYFGGEDKIVRIDLNEYVQNQDVSRLIADGARDSSSLTAQVMKKPFSVVLLDEIEKAHPNVLTTLLQLLDEGVLRDERNRDISFRDAIIIATSNAGADRIRELVMRGQQPAQFENQFIDELISSNQFRPEFLNRFDEIVVFTPLSKADLLKVVDLMIAGVNKTLKSQNIEVEVEQAAKELLVDKGYDPRLGARPMRRVVQKAIENTVAKAMLSGEATAGTLISISYGQVESILGSRQNADDVVNNV